MIKTFRIALVALFALFGGLSLQAVSAQMMHFNLDITIQTEDGANIPGGQVCVSGEVNPICQDIGGNPSGRDFYFSGLADGPHDVTISGADPYLDITDTVNLSQVDTSVTYTLQKEQPLPPTQPATEVPALPVTGAGTTAGTGGVSTALLMIVAMLALGCAAGSTVLMRKRR